LAGAKTGKVLGKVADKGMQTLMQSDMNKQDAVFKVQRDHNHHDFLMPLSSSVNKLSEERASTARRSKRMRDGL
jgi:hypothetical protein